MSATFIIPSGEIQATYDGPMPRHDCADCDITPTIDYKNLTLAYSLNGGFNSPDASTEKSELTSLYGSTDPTGLGDDTLSGSQNFEIIDTSSYSGGSFIAGAEVQAGAGVGPFFYGGSYGEFPVDNAGAGQDPVDDGTAYCIGSLYKGVFRFRVPLDPAWRDIDLGNLKVDYQIATQNYDWVPGEDGGGGNWVASGDPTTGSVQTSTISVITGATEAVGDWIPIIGSSGSQKYLTGVLRAYVDTTCIVS